jgi:type IV pilus biogenesis protein CpaD/CtpE
MYDRRDVSFDSQEEIMSIHHWSRKLLILIAALALMTGCASSESQPNATMNSLVTAQWLSEHLDDPDLVVLDCSVRRVC